MSIRSRRRKRFARLPAERLRRLLSLEGLESRCVLSPLITEYAVPTAFSAPEAIVAGPDGALWFAEGRTHTIGRINTTGTVSQFNYSQAASPAFESLAAGTGGKLWFVEENSNKIGNVTTAGVFQQRDGPGAKDPERIIFGPDGNLWYTDETANQITRMTTTGQGTPFALPTANAGAEGIASGPDGAIWFTEFDANKIGRITTSGTITEYTVPTAAAGLENLTAGPDGAVWFVELNANQIGRIATDGTIAEYALPTPNSAPDNLVAGPDGALWFTESGANQIGHITTTGQVTEYVLPNANSEPEGITVGPDGNIWFTEIAGNRIGRLVIDPPLTANGVSLQLTEGTTFQGTVASFTDGDPAATPPDYSVTISWGDGTTSAGTVVANSSGGFDVQGTHTYAEDGSASLTVTIQDVLGSSATATSSAAIDDAALTASGQSLSAVEGQAFSGTVATFTDADPGGSLGNYSASIAWGDGTTTSGVVTTNGSGGFTVTGSHTYAEEGAYTPRITIQDTGGATAAATASIQVADAALTSSGGTIHATEGTAFTETMASFTDADPNSALGDYSAVITWGDGTTSAGTVTANGSGGFNVAGSHTYAEEGSFTPSITITDAGGSTTTTSSSVVVADAPLGASGQTVNATEGQTFSGVVAVFTDADPAGTSGDYTASIRWGDGTSSTGIVQANGSGGFQVLGSHTWTEEGAFSISVSIQDAGGASTSVSGSATVADAPLTLAGQSITTTTGQAFSGTVASFTDADPNGTASDYTATITWGDGTSSAGTVVANGSGGFNVLGTHTYGADGSWTLGITVNDAATSTSAGGSANSQDAPLSATGLTVQAVEGQRFQGAVATFTDADPNGQVSEYTATIDWGDGTTTSGVVTTNGSGGFSVTGSHTYAEEGAHTLSITIQDAGGATATATAGFQVADAALRASGASVNATEGAAFTATVASFTDADPNGSLNDFSAVIAWGDGTTSAGTVTANGSGFNVVGTHSYAEEGTYTPSITITDAGGSTVATTGTATVADAALTATGQPIRGTEGQAFTGVVASFTDADPTGSASDYTATIAWGDGSTSAGTAQPNGAGGFDVVGSHTYVEEGNYPASVTVQDTGGSSATATPTATVSDAPLTAAGQNIQAAEGQAFSGAVASFTDLDGAGALGDYTASIGWGDGSTSSGTMVANAGGGFTIVGSHTWTDEGTYSITISLQDAGGATAKAVSRAQVADAAITLHTATIAPTEGLTFQGTVGSFTDANPLATPDDFQILVTWGDGTSSSAIVTTDGHGGFTVLGTHTWKEEGNYALQLALQDKGGTTTSVNGGQATVADAPLTATGQTIDSLGGQDYQGALASFTDANPNATPADFTATINWGDGSTSPGTVVANNRGGFDVLGEHAYAEKGTYAAQVSISDRGGTAAANASSWAVVLNAPLTLTGRSDTVSATQGVSTGDVVLASFTDANPEHIAGSYQALINWGDGTTSVGTVTAQGQGFVISGSHTYAATGAFGVTVTLQEPSGDRFTAAGSARVEAPPAPPQASPAPASPTFVGFVLPPSQATPAANTSSSPSSPNGQAFVSIVADLETGAHPLPDMGGSEASDNASTPLPPPAPKIVEQQAPPRLSLYRAQVPTPPIRPSVLLPLLPDRDWVHSSRVAQLTAGRAATWISSTELMEQSLDRLGKDLNPNGWPKSVDSTFVAGVTLTAGYVFYNLRTWYLVAGGILSVPLWRQLDPLAVLDVWEKEKRNRKLSGGRRDEDDDDEKELRPVFG